MKRKHAPFLGALFFATMTFSKGANEPLLMFGVLSDVQNTGQASDQEQILGSLGRCIDEFNKQNLEFVVHLGDLAEGDWENFSPVMKVLETLTPRLHLVIGNHDILANGTGPAQLLPGRSGYYDFATRGWRFVILDGTDLSVVGRWPPGSEQDKLSKKMFKKLSANKRDNALTYNGGIGEKQKTWLKAVLKSAKRNGERVVIFCHYPLLEGAGRPTHLLWNHREILSILDSRGGVTAVLSGHNHQEGYRLRNGVHHLTISGMIEAPAKNAFAIVKIFPDEIRIEGRGNVTSRILSIPETRIKETPTRN